MFADGLHRRWVPAAVIPPTSIEPLKPTLLGHSTSHSVQIFLPLNRPLPVAGERVVSSMQLSLHHSSRRSAWKNKVDIARSRFSFTVSSPGAVSKSRA
jgi:hypothetical protein